jgi:hypothetical protein
MFVRVVSKDIPDQAAQAVTQYRMFVRVGPSQRSVISRTASSQLTMLKDISPL